MQFTVRGASFLKEQTIGHPARARLHGEQRLLQKFVDPYLVMNYGSDKWGDGARAYTSAI